MILKDLLEVAMKEDGVGLDTTIVMDDGRGIVDIEATWDDASDEVVLHLFPQSKEDWEKERADLEDAS